MKILIYESLRIFSKIYSYTGSNNEDIIFNSKRLYKICMDSFSENINIFKIKEKKCMDFFYDKEIFLKESEKEVIIFFRKFFQEILKEIEEEIKIEKKLNIKAIDIFSEDYPEELKKIEVPPYILYGIGNTKEIKNKNSLGIVGTRNPEKYFSNLIGEEIGKILVEKNYNGIGGLALGCDSIGHEKILKYGGITGAILGQGLNREIYPRENKNLIKKILDKNGYVISEVPINESVKRDYLLRRNRIQGTIGKGIFVLETGLKGGTIKTIKDTLKENKKVFLWDPREKLEKNLSIEGNYGIIEKNKKMGISLKKMEKIILIKNGKELLEELEREENKFSPLKLF